VAVLVDFRPIGKLRGNKPVDVIATLGPALLAEAMPTRFPSVEVAVDFWWRTWAALHLFVTDMHAYRTGFRGPGTYDGSIVNHDRTGK
jgi:hypothetical protein